MSEENIVVYRVRYLDDRNEVYSWGRGTITDAESFCRRPKYPAHPSDSFIGVDDWGHGNIVAATPDLSTWIGKPYYQFRNECIR